jgi:hypothetical protein
MSRVRGGSCKKVEQADRYRDESCEGEVVVVEELLHLPQTGTVMACSGELYIVQVARRLMKSIALALHLHQLLRKRCN